MESLYKPVISLHNVTHGFNKKPLFSGITIEIQKGEFIGLIGPNGSGKTTLLSIINGMVKPWGGNIYINGNKLQNMIPKERAASMSFMMQPEHSLPMFSALEVVLTARYPYKRIYMQLTEKDYSIARKMLKYVEMEEFENHDFNTLSAGEKQLVLFARTLAQESNIILLDEPTSNLDITHKEKILSMAKSLLDEGKTVIAAIHDLNAAAKYASRLALLSKGKLSTIGTPDEVLTEQVLSYAYDGKFSRFTNPVTGKPNICYIP